MTRLLQAAVVAVQHRLEAEVQAAHSAAAAALGNAQEARSLAATVQDEATTQQTAAEKAMALA